MPANEQQQHQQQQQQQQQQGHPFIVASNEILPPPYPGRVPTDAQPTLLTSGPLWFFYVDDVHIYERRRASLRQRAGKRRRYCRLCIQFHSSLSTLFFHTGLFVPSFSGMFTLVLECFTSSYRVNWVSLGLTRFYRVILGFMGFT